MKKFTHLALLLTSILGFSSVAKAELLLEPVVGYSSGKVTTEPKGGDGSTDSVSGLSYGGRIGYQNFGFQLGVDYLASNMTADGDAFNTSEIGAFVGFEFPILLRVYAGYVLSGTAKGESDDGDMEFEGGTGPKVGIGFTLLPFLDVNLEYRSIVYDTQDVKVEDPGGSGTPINVELDTDYNA